MKREIKFRGKVIDHGGLFRDKKDGEWVYSEESFVHTDAGVFIGPYNEEVKVDPGTIGQFTGLKDKNGKDIYEGDIIDINYKYDACGINGVIPDQDCACLGVVLYNQYTAAYELRLIKAEYPIDVKGYDEEYSLNLYSFDLDGYIDLCGNIHDNPELLKNTK